jgi:protein arginine N-methyltransferase 1
MYTLIDYGNMVADRIRMDAYLEALHRTVGPGALVIDLGSGPGVLALLACRLGAERVIAVEVDESVALLGELAAANGCADRVEVFHGPSSELRPERRADVIVSDLRGVLPLFGRHLPTVVDARERLLRPGGRLIPERDELWVAPVAAPELHDRFVGPWAEDGYGLRLDGVRRLATNHHGHGRVPRDRLLAPPRRWLELDYRRVTEASFRDRLGWTVERSGTGHGLSIWFEASLVPGVGFSTAPWEPEMVYRTAFFPFSEAVALEAGDRLVVELAATLVGGEYVWTWHTTARRGGDELARFRQSTFFGNPLSAATLHRRGADHRPALGTAGRIDRFVLERMDGAATAEEIAAELRSAFPDRFPDDASALTRVGDLARRYGDGR